MSEDIRIQFENAVRKALEDFSRRLEQQRFFQIQNNLLKKLHEEIKASNYCNSETLEKISLEYEDFYTRLRGSGRSYENIVEEKNLVDTYSSFEKFLFDCFYAIYYFFPKYLGEQKTVAVSDLFIEGDIEICKRGIIESEVKDLIQKNNVSAIIDEFKKKFDIKTISVSEEDKNILHQISLIRNLVIHNNSIVNHVYIKQVRKIRHDRLKYKFDEDSTVLNKLEDLVEDIKSISAKVSEEIANAVIKDSNRLEKHHKNKV